MWSAKCHHKNGKNCLPQNAGIMIDIWQSNPTVKGWVMCGTVHGDMNLKNIVGSIVRVWYCILVPGLYPCVHYRLMLCIIPFCWWWRASWVITTENSTVKICETILINGLYIIFILIADKITARSGQYHKKTTQKIPCVVTRWFYVNISTRSKNNHVW